MASRSTILLLLVPVVAAAAATSVGLLTPTQQIQKSLEALEAGDYALAERGAARLAASGEDGAAHAWVIAAAALQRQGRFAQAAAAYRKYLPFCADSARRRYVQDQIARCQAAVAPPKPHQPPSAGLTERQRRELAVVEERTSVETSEHFTVHARNASLARLVARQAEAALARICRIVFSGAEYPHGVNVYVWPKAEDFAHNAVTAPEWAGGSFSIRPDENGRLLRRIDLTQLDEKDQFDLLLLDRVLPHEMSHLVLTEFFGDTHCPLAVNEGLAMLNEESVDNGRILLAGAAVGGDRGLPLARLLTVDRCNRENAAVVYAESYSLMRYLHARLTTEQFKDTLEHLKSGLPLDEAMQRALYVPAEEGFLDVMARAWAAEAIRQSHFLQALRQPDASGS